MIFNKLFPPKTSKKYFALERLLSFSDNVFGFSLTLLAADLTIPTLMEADNIEAAQALQTIVPNFFSFVISFMVVAILWVNHHHFYFNVKFADWRLMWLNNFLLFWIILIPFVTGFLGRYATLPLAVSFYSTIMFFSVLSFKTMVYYTFFKSDLMNTKQSLATRKSEYNRIFPALLLYLLGIFIPFWNVYIALVIFTIVTIWYFIPNYIGGTN